MTKPKAGPKLGRRYAFVKRRLLRLPQESHGMEVDFCPFPDIVEDEFGFWLGLAVDHDVGRILMTSILDEPPSAEDAADIMTRAMELSHPKVSCRPKMVFLRDNPTWEATFPWLQQLGIETVVTEDLLHWDAKAEELMDWMRKHWSPWPELRTEIHEKLGIFTTL
ncbi:MAG: hypothetical protein NTY19_04180, partial [Planctomycetota bacterium]|nr:hypothetical protein [Planctomycetota bacterium]